MDTKYSDEEVADIKAREVKALADLKKLGLTPAAQVHKVNIGDDRFVDKVVPFLQDIKYKK